MKYPLTKYQKILCAVAAAAFAVWMIVTAVLGAVTDIGTKWHWTVAESVVFTVVLCLVLCFPAGEKKKSYSERIEREYVDLRRDLVSRLLVIENVFMFVMALTHMLGWTKEGTVIAKVGVIHLVGMGMMIAIAACAVDFAVRAKRLKLTHVVTSCESDGRDDKKDF